jgi:hypothetical protein
MMKVKVVEIMVNSSNEFEGIVNEIESTVKKEGTSMKFNGSYMVHSIDFVEGGIVVNVVGL